jgi:hypothetical protein
MKSLVAAMMALTAVFAFTSTTAASAASKDEVMQRIMERELMDMERSKDLEMYITQLLMLELESLRNQRH